MAGGTNTESAPSPGVESPLCRLLSGELRTSRARPLSLSFLCKGRWWFLPGELNQIMLVKVFCEMSVSLSVVLKPRFPEEKRWMI